MYGYEVEFYIMNTVYTHQFHIKKELELIISQILPTMITNKNYLKHRKNYYGGKTGRISLRMKCCDCANN